MKKKKKYKSKYKFNLLNPSYSYKYSYIASYIYSNLYKVNYLKQFIINRNNNLNTIVLYYNKIFVKKKQKRSIKYDVIIGSGNNTNWVGIGSSKTSMYKTACNKSSDKSKKHIYNLNFMSNDYKMFKYKNYKFSLLNKSPNKKNLNIYNNITFLSGSKKLKLISYTKAPKKTVLKAVLHYFN
nr:ribosomal protein S5 [Babesia sp. Xinjiang]